MCLYTLSELIELFMTLLCCPGQCFIPRFIFKCWRRNKKLSVSSHNKLYWSYYREAYLSNLVKKHSKIIDYFCVQLKTNTLNCSSMLAAHIICFKNMVSNFKTFVSANCITGLSYNITGRHGRHVPGKSCPSPQSQWCTEQFLSRPDNTKLSFDFTHSALCLSR